MELKQLIETLFSLQVHMWIDIDEDKLYYSPVESVTKEIKDSIIQHKREIMKILYDDFKKDLDTQRENIDDSKGLVFPPMMLGPGTELKKMLAIFGFQENASCSCNSKAKIMDSWGCDECEKRSEEIIGWLRDEAKKRKLPFIDLVGKLLLKRAIKLARLKENKK